MRTNLTCLGIGLTLMLAAGPASATGDRIVLATGTLVKGTTTYPVAVITYNPVLDASDAGSNPGIELWPDAISEAAGTSRLSRSNDNNGQWDYAPAGAVFANNTVTVFGTRTGSHGPQGRTWTFTGGSFLVQGAAQVSCGTETSPGVTTFGEFAGITKGNAVYSANVVYDQNVDDTDVGNPPGLTVVSSANAPLWRANDNNGQWDYRIDCSYAAGGIIYIVGGRSANNRATYSSRVWRTGSTGGFLIQSPGF